MNPLLLNTIWTMGQSLLDRFFPDPEQRAAAQLELLKMQQQGDFKEIDAALARDLAQADINKMEASSTNSFVSGWRPAAGWVCVLGLMYQFLLRPMAPWLLNVFGHPVPELPSLEGSLMELTFAMLGLGGLRTFDKVKGVASGNPSSVTTVKQVVN